MADFVTDTHALVWYLRGDTRLGSQASEAFASCDSGEATIWLPTICLVEMVYVEEKARIPPGTRRAFHAAVNAGETGFAIAALTAQIAESLASVPRADVPELPDRIIAATAMHLGVPLITRDQELQLSSVPTIW
jgi:PIN domain nuclease of toxin-antitoxin system